MKEKALTVLNWYLNGGIAEIERQLNLTIKFVCFDYLGCCFKVNGALEIWINKNLDFETRLKVLFHEIYHAIYDAEHLYEVPALYKRNELKANYFSNLIIQKLREISHEI